MISSVIEKIHQMHTRTEPQRATQAPELPLPPLSFRQADQWAQVDGAFSLVYQCYRNKNLISRNNSGLRVTHYNLLRETATFVAEANDEVIATVSLVPDSASFGLPMGQLYDPELDCLRNQGRRLAEISALAVAPAYKPISILLLMNLVQVLYQYSQKLDITDLVIACHPKHARLYRRLFLFESVGELRTYQAVNDAPAVAVRLDLTNVRERYQQTYADDGFTLYRFLFSDEMFRHPDAALRVGAFGPEIIQRLLEIQPELAHTLEHGRPGLVNELAGAHDMVDRIQALWNQWSSQLPVQAFVAG